MNQMVNDTKYRKFSTFIFFSRWPLVYWVLKLGFLGIFFHLAAQHKFFSTWRMIQDFVVTSFYVEVTFYYVPTTNLMTSHPSCQYLSCIWMRFYRRDASKFDRLFPLLRVWGRSSRCVKNLYTWGGVRSLASWCSRIESYLKD